MLTTIILILFLSSYCFYNTSKRAKLPKEGLIEQWLQANVSIAKSLGLLLLVIGFALSIYSYGTGTGTFIWAMILMQLLGALILLAPMKLFNYKHTLAFFILILIVELSIQ